jgi:hypothetical protein
VHERALVARNRLQYIAGTATGIIFLTAIVATAAALSHYGITSASGSAATSS